MGVGEPLSHREAPCRAGQLHRITAFLFEEGAVSQGAHRQLPGLDHVVSALCGVDGELYEQEPLAGRVPGRNTGAKGGEAAMPHFQRLGMPKSTRDEVGVDQAPKLCFLVGELVPSGLQDADGLRYPISPYERTRERHRRPCAVGRSCHELEGLGEMIGGLRGSRGELGLAKVKEKCRAAQAGKLLEQRSL